LTEFGGNREKKTPEKKKKQKRAFDQARPGKIMDWKQK